MEKTFPKVMAFSIVPCGEFEEWTVVGPVAFSPEGEMSVPAAEGVIVLKGTTPSEEAVFVAMFSAGEVFMTAEGMA